MLYTDTVESEVLVHKPWFVGMIFVLVFALSFMTNLTGTTMGELMRPVIGDPLASGFYGRFAIALVISVVFCLNIIFIGLVLFEAQVVIVWLELLLLFLAFFNAFDLSLPFIRQSLPILLSQGLFTTVYVATISIFFATIIAVVGAIAKLSGNGFAFAISSFYTSFFRGLPLLVQLYLIYLGLPQLGIIIDAVPSGVLALSLCYGAFMAEVFRAGIQSIDRGQWEASRSMGFGFALTMRKVILPQALPVIIPPTGNQFISMLKDSSLVSIVGVWELMFLARSLGQATFKHMEMLIAVALIYWVLSICMEFLQARIENHYARSKVR
ncbi:amino acid ABC transporter permease [Sinorhizobium medicae]|uniref:amino acid ABC transporter permease n=1 Tax=Sinorhizobium medicae TaxID=110321 RepID=UPI00048604EE|nr:amino acid ABC transporter permease [Sinorhizobium medicae]